MKPSWEMTEADVEACLKATTWYPANRDYFRGGGFSSNFLTRGGMPVTMSRLNLVKGLGPVLQIAEGWTVDIDPEINKVLDKRTDLAYHMVCAASLPWARCIQGCVFGDEQLGSQPWRNILWPYRCRPHHPCLDSAYPCVHAQCH